MNSVRKIRILIAFGILFFSLKTANADVCIGKNNIGVGTCSPSTAVQVIGTVSATTFSGSGSQLTGISVSTQVYLSGNSSITNNVCLEGSTATITTAITSNILVMANITLEAYQNGWTAFFEILSSSSNSGKTSIKANEVWRIFSASNGEMRTKRCVPCSDFK